MKILVAGFNPFGGLDVNSSEVVVRRLSASICLDGAEIATVVLRTEFAHAGDEIMRLIRDIQPDAVLGVGMSSEGSCLCFEQIARNWDSSSSPDNSGELRVGQKIVQEGPEFYRATLPYDMFRAALERQGIASMFSDDAGGYVCNHVFYRACYEIDCRQLNVRCGFVHIPSLATATLEGAASVNVITQAVATCLSCLTQGAVSLD